MWSNRDVGVRQVNRRHRTNHMSLREGTKRNEFMQKLVELVQNGYESRSGLREELEKVR
jgi:hypothetical protein